MLYLYLQLKWRQTRMFAAEKEWFELEKKIIAGSEVKAVMRASTVVLRAPLNWFFSPLTNARIYYISFFFRSRC